MAQDKLALIRQSLAAAESSIKTAKQLLSEVESGGLKPSAKDLPGEVGVFDGVNLVSEKGEKYPVPPGYASKSMLVIGDTLKLVDEDGEKRFKQIEHVKRHKTTGILHKKDGKFKVITPEGSYNVLNAAIEHFSGEVGDEVILHIPASNLAASFGAVEQVIKKVHSVEETDEPKEQPAPQPKKEDPKPPAPVQKSKPAPRKEPPKPPPKPVEASKPAPAPVATEVTVTPPAIDDDELR